MATFSVQIQALVGSVTESEIDDWCAEGAKEIINVLPLKLKEECSTLTNLYIGNTDTVMDLDLSGEIFYVTRENADSGYHTPCRRINPKYGDLASDSGNIIYYATATDPVFWTGSDSGGDPKLFVKPTPTATQPAKVYHVAYPTVSAIDASSIVNFPDEAEYLVVLYASCKVLQNKMNEKSSSLPSDLSTFVLPVAPIVPTISAQVVATFVGAPTYIPPVANFDVSQLETFIETEEDTELAQAQISRIQVELSKYQADMTNALNTFNKESTIYQADIQENIKEAELLDAHESRKLQKYQFEVGTYSAQVGSNVQKFGQDLANYTAKIQKQGIEYQWLQGQYSQLKQDYTQGMQILAGAPQGGGK
mgnify:CR=1 FL=1